MITLKTGEGKYYFSTILSLTSGQEVSVDEEKLLIGELKNIYSAIIGKRLEASTSDTEVVRGKIKSFYASTGGGTDPELLEGKEDISNKVDVVSSPTTTEYPSTKGLIDYVASKSFLVNTDLQPYVKTTTYTTGLALKADKNELTNYALKTSVKKVTTEDPSLKITETASEFKVATVLDKRADDQGKAPLIETLPTSTLGKDGETPSYLLCTPDKWIITSDGYYVPAYSKTTMGIVD